MGTLSQRLDLKVGFACNNHCIFCAQGQKRRVAGSLAIDDLVDRLRAARPAATGVVLTGGEPTLHKELLHVVRSAKRLGYEVVQVQTNGRLLSYPRVVESLIDAGANEFAVALHGIDAPTHDGLTRAEGSYEQTVAGIRNVAASSASLVTNTVITRDNVSTLDHIVDLLVDLGAHNSQLAFVHPVGTAKDEFDRVVPDLPSVVAPLRRAAAVASARKTRLVTEAVPLCFLPGMTDLAVEEEIPRTVVADLNGELADFTKWRIADGKAHGPPCDRCSARHRCEGPWREYPERRGWSEFTPL